MTVKDPVLSNVDATGVEYEVVACDPNLADTAEFCQAYGYSLAQSANAIVVVGKSDPRVYACCVVLATTRLNVNTTVRKRLGAKKASFASADETRAITGMEIGGVTPFGLPAGLAVWIDAAVMSVDTLGFDKVIVGGGSRDRKLLVRPEALAALPNASIVDDLASPADD